MELEQKELAEIKTQVITVQDKAMALQVSSQAEMDYATEVLHNVKQAEKYLDERKTNITRPLMKSLSSIRELFKPLELQLSETTKIIKSKMLAYQIEEEARIQKEKDRISARVERGTMLASTAAGKLEAVGDGPKSNIRTLKKVRIIDETIIPREWLEPSMIRITEAVIRKGIEIPGVEVYSEKQIVAK